MAKTVLNFSIMSDGINTKFSLLGFRFDKIIPELFKNGISIYQFSIRSFTLLVNIFLVLNSFFYKEFKHQFVFENEF